MRHKTDREIVVMIPDYNEAELKTIHDILNERYREEKETQLADVELHMNKDDLETVDCPSVYWEHNGCNFLLSKVEDNKFCSQFFYQDGEQYGTGKKFDPDQRSENRCVRV